MRTHNIPYVKENRKDIPIVPPDLALLSTLIGSNYPCLELTFMVPKVFEPVNFYCTRNTVLTAKLLKQGYRYHKLRKAFSKFYRLLQQALSEPEFYGDLVYKFRKIIGKNDFPYHFKNIVVRYQKIGYIMDVLRQTACLIVYLIKVNSLLTSLIARR